MDEVLLIPGYIVKAVGSAAKAVAAAVAALALAYWDGAPEALRALICGLVALMSADFILGIAASVKQRGWRSIRSDIMARTLLKALAYFGSLLAAWGIDRGLHTANAVQLWIALLASLAEAKSVAENSGALGFPWPKGLLEKLADWQDKFEQMPPGGMECTPGEEGDER